MLYRSKIYTIVNELHWFLYSNCAAEGENLPPTYGALDLHIRRTHYIVMIWRKANENIHACQRLLHSVGPLMLVQVTSPVWCLNPPAPESMLHLIKWKCKRGCEGNSSCCKNTIPCTEVCGCWVFTCNNKTNQLAINEECEDDWPIHRVTFSFVLHKIIVCHVISTLL